MPYQNNASSENKWNRIKILIDARLPLVAYILLYHSYICAAIKLRKK